MQFSATAESVMPCLALISDTVDSRDPVKSLVRISVSKGAVDVYSTTGNSGTCVSIPDVSIKAAGVVMVDCAKLVSALRECAGDVHFTIKNSNLKITSGTKEFQIITAVDSKNFPFKEQVEFGVMIVGLQLLREAIRMCLPATNTIRAEDSKGATFESVGKVTRVSAISRNAAAGATSLIKCPSSFAQPIITSMEFCKHIISLGMKDEEIAIGVSGGTISVSHRYGYSYFPILHGKPISSETIVPRLKMDSKFVLASAGLMAKAIRSVLVMSSKDDGNKGRLTGKKGQIAIYAHTNESGAARDTVVTAGDILIDNWYNLRSLLDYISKVHPEEEIGLHTVAKGDDAALVVRHGTSVYYLANCEPPHDKERGKE